MVAAIAGVLEVKKSALCAALIAVAFIGVTAPFYLADSVHFSPLHVAGRTSYPFIPHSEIVLSALMAVIAVVAIYGAWWAVQRYQPVLAIFTICAIVQAFHVMVWFTLNSISADTLPLGTLSYGIFGMFFGIIAAVRIIDSSPVSAPQPRPTGAQEASLSAGGGRLGNGG